MVEQQYLTAPISLFRAVDFRQIRLKSRDGKDRPIDYFSALELKILFLLIREAYFQIKDRRGTAEYLLNKFVVSLEKIKKQIYGDKKYKNNKKIKETIKELGAKLVVYEGLKDNENKTIREGNFTLLGNIDFTFYISEKKCLLTYSIPQIVFDFFTKPQNVKNKIVYSKVFLNPIFNLKNPYSIRLFELISHYKDVQIPILNIAEFRRAFNVQNKYHKIQDLRRYVLGIAAKEINESPYIPYQVDFDFLKRDSEDKKRYSHIKITFKKVDKKAKLEDTEVIEIVNEIENDIKEEYTPKKIDPKEVIKLAKLIPEKVRTPDLEISLGSFVYKYGYYYVKAQIDFVNHYYSKGEVRNYIGYLNKAVAENLNVYCPGQKTKLEIEADLREYEREKEEEKKAFQAFKGTDKEADDEWEYKAKRLSDILNKVIKNVSAPSFIKEETERMQKKYSELVEEQNRKFLEEKKRREEEERRKKNAKIEEIKNIVAGKTVEVNLGGSIVNVVYKPDATPVKCFFIGEEDKKEIPAEMFRPSLSLWEKWQKGELIVIK